MNKQFSTLRLFSGKWLFMTLVLLSLNQIVFAQDEDIDFEECPYSVTTTLGNLPHGGPFTTGTGKIEITTLHPTGGTIAITAINVSGGIGTLPTPYTSPVILDIPNTLTTGITFTFSSTQLTISCDIPKTYASIGKKITFTVQATPPNGGTACDRTYEFVIDGTGSKLGDPHITTVEDIHYDFQSWGEFVALKDSSGSFEVQTRQTGVATNGPGFDSYTGLATCVSLNTAVAARVGTHRVTYEPNIDGKPDPSGMQLRVDGNLTKLGDNGLDLGSGGRIIKSSDGDGIEIDFPNGTTLVATSNWWAHYGVWYLNVKVYHATSTNGIMGAIPFRSWLPALPDGSSLGPRPDTPHVRFVQLYRTFADAWRVGGSNASLFDYASPKTTDSFTVRNWPAESAQTCSVPQQTPLPPITLEVAQDLCRDIVDSSMKANAIFDVMITGEASFAKAYLTTQKIQNGTTRTSVTAGKDSTKYKEPVTFTAIVSRKFSTNAVALAGSVEFTVDGKKFEQVNLEANGRAILTTTSLEVGRHQIAAKFMPADSTAFSSSSLEVTHTVIGAGTPILHQWWFWALLILLLIILFLIFRKKKP